ncbi:hypothetical protein [Halopiger goleimassiliensis]|uniref:hypothetical protein n=1 Tax=Halopiger goleimassiliensis TaxID=1293048 RepID=UPI000A4131C5|nr:hypothetical protein [Halopiger goleimassiliensis]
MDYTLRIQTDRCRNGFDADSGHLYNKRVLTTDAETGAVLETETLEATEREDALRE